MTCKRVANVWEQKRANSGLAHWTKSCFLDPFESGFYVVMNVNNMQLNLGRLIMTSYLVDDIEQGEAYL